MKPRSRWGKVGEDSRTEKRVREGRRWHPESQRSWPSSGNHQLNALPPAVYFEFIDSYDM